MLFSYGSLKFTEKRTFLEFQDRDQDRDQPMRRAVSCPTLEGSGAGPVSVATCAQPLLSIGSKGHDEGTCRPCSFYRRGTCVRGLSCYHCHAPHVYQARLGLKIRRRLARRALRQALEE